MVAGAGGAPAILAPRTPRVPRTPMCAAHPSARLSADVGMRRNRPSFPVRFRSARESDLRASSLPCGSHYVVELRIDASFAMTPGLHRSSPDLLHRELLAARPSPLPSTCSHHKCSTMQRAIGQRLDNPLVHKKLHFSTPIPSIPRYSQHHRAPIGRRCRPRPTPNATRPPRNLSGLDQHENRPAQILADSTSAKTRRTSRRHHVSAAPVSLSPLTRLRRLRRARIIMPRHHRRKSPKR